MRLTVGILGLSIGILLPIITALLSNCYFLQESISHYYYTIAGDVFVGLLCAVAFFLIIYPGEGRWEDLWANIAGICAIGVALFPTGYHQQNDACTRKYFDYDNWVSTVHLLSAGAFFIILGGVAIFQFPKITAPMTAKELVNRQWFYKGCGIVMWLCIAALAPMKLSDNYNHFLSVNKVVFFAEVIALVAFGCCWLTKGTELQSEKVELQKK
jgi:multisubunit Na+/H+ antiporter MnhG subunit